MISHKPVFLLVTASYDGDQYLPNIGKENFGIKEALRKAQEGGVQVETLPYFEMDQLAEKLLEFDGRLVGLHIAAHGTSDELFDSTWSSMSQTSLSVFLKKQQHLAFVFLNACLTASTKKLFLKADLPCLLGSKVAVRDDVAAAFAIKFYKHLGRGESLEKAYEKAQNAIIFLQQGEAAERTPVIGENTSDPCWQIYFQDHEIKKWSFDVTLQNPVFGLPPLPIQKLPTDPYVFFRNYETEEAELFFGRGNEIQTLYEILFDHDLPKILLLSGQSGVGKTSLLKAGIMPRAKQHFDVQYMTYGDHSRYWFPNIAKRGSSKNEKYLVNEKPLLLIIDQFEQVFTKGSEEEQRKNLQTFFKEVSEFFKEARFGGTEKLLLVLREEFYLKVDFFLRKQRMDYNPCIYVERLQEEQIIRIIEGVQSRERLRKRYRITIEPNLPKRIAMELFKSEEAVAIAPVLQILLYKMWKIAREKFPRAREVKFNTELYEEVKLESALPTFLDISVTNLSTYQTGSRKHLLSYISLGLHWDLLNYFVYKNSTSKTIDMEVLKNRYQHLSIDILELLSVLEDQYLLQRVLSNRGTEEVEDKSIKYRISHDLLVPIIHNRYLSSSRNAQLAARLLDNMKQMPTQGHWFTQKQVKVIEAGKYGMRDWSEVEKIEIQKSKAKAWRAKQSVIFSLALFASVIFLAYFHITQNNKANRLFTEGESLINRDPTQAFDIIRTAYEFLPIWSLKQKRNYKAELIEIYREHRLYQEVKENLSKVVLANDGILWSENYEQSQYSLSILNLDLQKGVLTDPPKDSSFLLPGYPSFYKLQSDYLFVAGEITDPKTNRKKLLQIDLKSKSKSWTQLHSGDLSPNSLDLNYNKDTLIISEIVKEKSLVIKKIYTGELIDSIAFSVNTILTITKINPVTREIYVGTEKGGISLVDLKSRSLRELHSVSGSIRHIAFSKDENKLAFASTKTAAFREKGKGIIRLISSKSGEEIRAIEAWEGGVFLAMQDDETHYTIKIYDWIVNKDSDLVFSDTFKVRSMGEISQIHFSEPDRKLIAIDKKESISRLKVWDLGGFREVLKIGSGNSFERPRHILKKEEGVYLLFFSNSIQKLEFDPIPFAEDYGSTNLNIDLFFKSGSEDFISIDREDTLKHITFSSNSAITKTLGTLGLRYKNYQVKASINYGDKILLNIWDEELEENVLLQWKPKEREISSFFRFYAEESQFSPQGNFLSLFEEGQNYGYLVDTKSGDTSRITVDKAVSKFVFPDEEKEDLLAIGMMSGDVYLYFSNYTSRPKFKLERSGPFYPVVIRKQLNQVLVVQKETNGSCFLEFWHLNHPENSFDRWPLPECFRDIHIVAEGKYLIGIGDSDHFYIWKNPFQQRIQHFEQIVNHK